MKTREDIFLVFCSGDYELYKFQLIFLSSQHDGIVMLLSGFLCFEVGSYVL